MPHYNIEAFWKGDQGVHSLILFQLLFKFASVSSDPKMHLKHAFMFNPIPAFHWYDDFFCFLLLPQNL